MAARSLPSIVTADGRRVDAGAGVGDADEQRRPRATRACASVAVGGRVSFTQKRNAKLPAPAGVGLSKTTS